MDEHDFNEYLDSLSANEITEVIYSTSNSSDLVMEEKSSTQELQPSQ